jgi:hypothetical protein
MSKTEKQPTLISWIANFWVADRTDSTNLMRSLIDFAWADGPGDLPLVVVEQPEHSDEPDHWRVWVATGVTEGKVTALGPRGGVSVGELVKFASFFLRKFMRPDAFHALEETFRDHLNQLVDAAEKLNGRNPKSTEAIIPMGVVTATNSHLPAIKLQPNGRLRPEIPLRNLGMTLYFALALALAEGVLFRMGRCAWCKRPVVHERRRRGERLFCDDLCKTQFFNVEKEPPKTPTQRGKREKDSRARLRRFLIAPPFENRQADRARMRALGGGAARVGCRIVDEWKTRMKAGEPIDKIWRTMSMDQKRVFA